MALIQFGLGISQASGKVGGHVISHNRNGQYVRQKGLPVNPNTAAQQAIRDTLGSLATDWRELTEAQRTGWTGFGAQIQRINRLGQTYNLTGLQSFVMTNSIRLFLGEATIDDAPAVDQLPTILTLSAAYSLGLAGFDLTYTAANATADTRWLIFATNGVSDGRQFFRRSEYRFIADFPGNEASPIDVTTAYVAKFAAPVAGEKISVLMIPWSINRIPGVPVRADVIVTA